MASLRLVRLAQEGNLDVVKAFVEANPEAVRRRNPETGRLPLHDLLSWWENLQAVGVWRIVSRDIVAVLINAYPRALVEADFDGNTPLHTIVKIDCNYGHGQFDLVYGGAKCVSGFRNEEGQLPIHIAIENGNHYYSKVLIEQDYCSMASQEPGLLKLAITRSAGSDIIQELVRRNPNSAKELDADGVLPIQYALTKGHTSPEVIQALSDIHPESLSIPDKDGELPLHIAAGYYHGQDQGDRIQVLQELGKSFPTAFSTANDKGELPLHLAIIYESQITDDQSVDVLRAVTTGYPKAHQMADCNGNLPLHVACSFYQNDLSIITYLIDQNPTVLHTVNYNGCFPLHVAARSDLPVSALQYLIEQFPRVMGMQDCEGNLPLHHAVQRDCFLLESVQLLVEKCPAAARHANMKGRLPLHLACLNFAPPPVLEALIEAYPEALSSYDGDGKLPVHLSCVKREPDTSDAQTILSKQVETVGYILKTIKSSPATKDKMPALFVACTSHAPLEVIMLLAEKSPELFSEDGSNVKPSGKRCWNTTPLSPLDLALQKRYRIDNDETGATAPQATAPPPPETTQPSPVHPPINCDGCCEEGRAESNFPVPYDHFLDSSLLDDVFDDTNQDFTSAI
jgi:ankyrin repeat protein